MMICNTYTSRNNPTTIQVIGISFLNTRGVISKLEYLLSIRWQLWNKLLPSISIFFLFDKTITFKAAKVEVEIDLKVQGRTFLFL